MAGNAALLKRISYTIPCFSAFAASRDGVFSSESRPYRASIDFRAENRIE